MPNCEIWNWTCFELYFFNVMFWFSLPIKQLRKSARRNQHIGAFSRPLVVQTQKCDFGANCNEKMFKSSSSSKQKFRWFLKHVFESLNIYLTNPWAKYIYEHEMLDWFLEQVLVVRSLNFEGGRDKNKAFQSRKHDIRQKQSGFLYHERSPIFKSQIGCNQQVPKSLMWLYIQ